MELLTVSQIKSKAICHSILPIFRFSLHVLTVETKTQMCGSSALPQPIQKEWELVTGHQLLERYGMTEVSYLLVSLSKDYAFAIQFSLYHVKTVWNGIIKSLSWSKESGYSRQTFTRGSGAKDNLYNFPL
jgi:acyl-CoA synthetase (AMP-forming)/AMP-acid ligase II